MVLGPDPAPPANTASLHAFIDSPFQVGSQKWHTQHEWIERLNIQASGVQPGQLCLVGSIAQVLRGGAGHTVGNGRAVREQRSPGQYPWVCALSLFQASSPFPCLTPRVQRGTAPVQAHYNAQTHSDEFVVELLVSLDKIHVSTGVRVKPHVSGSRD